MTKKTVIFGYPGTGKTTTLMEIIEKLISRGIKPEEICLCTFTKSGANVAKSKAKIKFGFTNEQLGYFSTIHSICFRRFCFGKEVISSKQLKEFFDTQKMEFKEEDKNYNEDLIVEQNLGEEDGNILINFYNLFRIVHCKGIQEVSNKEELREGFHKLNKEEDFMKIFSNAFDPYNVLKDYESFKEKNNLIDFADMLLMAYKSKWVVPTKILIVDEAQDMNPLQWAIYVNWCQGKEEVYVAGDDDQSIYSFHGADYKRLLAEKELADDLRILDITYRLPNKIHTYCKDYIDSNIHKSRRIEKDVSSVKAGGEVIEEEIDYLEETLKHIDPTVKTYILFRTNNYKREFINEVLIPKGVVYGELRGNSIWTNKSILIFNGLLKLRNKQNIDREEMGYLVEAIPAEFKLLKRGLKKKIKDGLISYTTFSKERLIEIGFEEKFFESLEENKILNLLNIKENLKKAFVEVKQQLISYPLKLYLGTIHSSKGDEAEDVIVFRIVNTRIARAITSSKQEWENEIRLQHVANSRAKRRLIILRGGFDYGDSYLLP